MSTMLMVKPLTPAAVAASTGTGGANLVTFDPKEVWASTAAGGAANLDFDFGANVSIDSLFIGYMGNVVAPIMTWSSGTAAYTTTVNQNAVSALAPTASSAPPRRHGFWRLGAPVVHRYHRVAFSPVAAQQATIGIIIFGLAFQPTWNREWGGGRQIIDTSTVTPLRGGGYGIDEGAVKASFSWTFGDLTDAEVEAIYDIGLDRGQKRPLLVVEDPAATSGQNERLHYGVFDRFEKYERANPNLNRWSLSVMQWV